MRRSLRWILTGASVALLFTGGLWVWRAKHYSPTRFDGVIDSASERYGVDPALVKAVIWRESSFNASARGQAGEIGLMQIRELAAVDWSTSQGLIGFEMAHLENPTTNILAGTWYLAHLLKRYSETDDPVPYALADYNAGRANVRKWMKAEGAATSSAVFMDQITFPGTRRYIEAVMKQRRRYEPGTRARSP